MLRKHDQAILVCPPALSLPEADHADWIGVDAGYKVILKNRKQCLFAIGDFDSAPLDASLPFPVFRYPVHKDETDSELALAMAWSMGYTSVCLWGALGGRLDHTLANLRCVTWKYPRTVCMDENQRITVLECGRHEIEKHYRHVSFFAMEPSIITLEGFDYPLEKRAIGPRDFYTCSNSIAKDKGIVIVDQGRVLCVETSCA